MFDTATFTHRGESWFFQSFDNGLGENAEGHGIAKAPLPLLPAGAPVAGETGNIAAPRPGFDQSFHAFPITPRGH